MLEKLGGMQRSSMAVGARKQSEQVGSGHSNNNLRKSMTTARKYTNLSSQHNERVETNEDEVEGEVLEEESPAVTFLS